MKVQIVKYKHIGIENIPIFIDPFTAKWNVLKWYKMEVNGPWYMDLTTYCERRTGGGRSSSKTRLTEPLWITVPANIIKHLSTRSGYHQISRTPNSPTMFAKNMMYKATESVVNAQQTWVNDIKYHRYLGQHVDQNSQQ